MFDKSPNIWIPRAKFVDGGIDINLSPSAEWFVEIKDTDGTIRPAKCCEGGKWIKNTFTNGFKDQFCGGAFATDNGTVNTNMIGIFYGQGTVFPPYFQMGTSNTAAAATQTCLQAYSKTATAFYSTGNNITFNSNGNIVVAVKQSFATEVGTTTYYEAGQPIYIGPGTPGNFLGNSPSASANTPANYVLMNRVVFGAGIPVTAGQTVIMTMAVTIPSLYNNPATVSIGASNGINISGQLALVGTQATIAGGTVTGAGAYTPGTYQWTLWPTCAGHNALNALNGNHVFALTGHNSIITAGTNGANMSSGTTNSIVALPASSSITSTYTPGSFTAPPYTTGVGGSYAGSGNFSRNMMATWIPGNPASPTGYNSLMFALAGVSGYQLLFTSQQTFGSGATFIFTLNFAIA